MKALTTFILLLLVSSPTVSAQSGMPFGVSGFAEECYRESRAAVRLGSTSNRALLSCDRAIKEGVLKKRDRAATFVNRGILYMQLGKPSLALQDYDSAIALQGDTGEAFLNRGNIAFISNRLLDAENDYNHALDLGVEQMHVAFLNRGMVREIQKNFPGARSDYESALDLRENWSEALMRLDRVSKKLASSESTK